MINIAPDHKRKILILAREFLITECFVDTTEGTQGRKPCLEIFENGNVEFVLEHIVPEVCLQFRIVNPDLGERGLPVVVRED